MGGSPRRSSRTSRAERRPSAGPGPYAPVSPWTCGSGQGAASVTHTETPVPACVAVSSRVADHHRCSPTMQKGHASRPCGGRDARAICLTAWASPTNWFSYRNMDPVWDRRHGCEALSVSYAKRRAGLRYNRLRVFRRANTAHLGRGGGPERWWHVGPSEKYAAR